MNSYEPNGHDHILPPAGEPEKDIRKRHLITMAV